MAASQRGGVVLRDEPLARHTTFRIGGPADLYAAANTIDQLETLANLAIAHSIPVTVLGGGSNVLVSDAGVRGLVIVNQTRAFRFVALDSGSEDRDRPETIQDSASNIPNANLIADSGVALAGLARSAIRKGWAGLEWAISVPGTVGGAVIGNAGAHGGQIADNLAWALVVYPGQGRRVLTKAELDFAYRSSILKSQLAAIYKPGFSEKPSLLAAGFKLQRGDVAELTARADAFLARRRASQPVEPSAGSIFRNPPGDYAGRLVEAAGLKGHRIGGAQISLRHANFIVNIGNARAADVFDLMKLMCTRVYEQCGVELALEIMLLGEWPERSMPKVDQSQILGDNILYREPAHAV